MDVTWIVVTNSSDAYFYQLDEKEREKGKVKLNLVASYHHPKSRQKGEELITDRAGHFISHNTAGTLGHGSYENPTDPKKHEAEVFARQIADELANAKNTHQFDELILITPPQFHGLLNKHFHKNVANSINIKIEKDYTKTASIELKEYLEPYLINSD